MAFEDIVIEENKSSNNGNGGEFKDTVYMKAKQDFPINVAQEHRIVDAHATRQRFANNKPACVSFDGELGRIPATGYKETVECAECKYKKGKDPETGEELDKCQYKLALIIEHEDPEKEYQIKISYGSQLEFSKYIKELAAENLSPDKVITAITRIENPDGPGGLYQFEKVSLAEGVTAVSEAEQTALDDLVKKIVAMGETVDVDFAAEMLMKVKSLGGITKEKALELVESVATDGMISGE